MKVGFIGNGFVNKNYADNFESRSFAVVRYDNADSRYSGNRELIKDCDVVFVAVPTPTVFGTGFDDSVLFDVAHLVGREKILIIKSTVLPDTTTRLQDKFPDIFVMHSPEFLAEKTARWDVDNPVRNIIGFTPKSATKTDVILSILPRTKDTVDIVCPAAEAAAIKYGGNVCLYFKVLFMNMLFDFCVSQGIDFDVVKEGMKHDRRIGASHMEVLYDGGRGAGGHCFPKDSEAFRQRLQELSTKGTGAHFLLGASAILSSMADYNDLLLRSSGKNLDIAEKVYGKKN